MLKLLKKELKSKRKEELVRMKKQKEGKKKNIFLNQKAKILKNWKFKKKWN